MQGIVRLILMIIIFSCSQKKQELNPVERSIFNKKIVSIKTSLKDTLTIVENTIVFLRPDSFRFQYYELTDEHGIYEIDSDFGFGINSTIDSINKYNLHINYMICDKRFIKINNCNKCPNIIDRDTIDYGVILISNKKGIKFNYHISSIGYFSLANDYLR